MIKTKTCVNFTRTETKTSYYKHQVILNYKILLRHCHYIVADPGSVFPTPCWFTRCGDAKVLCKCLITMTQKYLVVNLQ